ncbi:hypothetical protein ACMSYW_000679 [Cronobacter dublinensis]
MANGTMSPALPISFQAGCENRAAGALRLPAQFYFVFLSRVGKRSAPTSRDIPFIKAPSQNLIPRALHHHFSLFLTSLHIYVAPLHHHVSLFYSKTRRHINKPAANAF